MRVSRKLKQALSSKLEHEFVPVVWHSGKKAFTNRSKRSILKMSATDCFLTPEIFSSDDRPGYHDCLIKSGVRSAAVFHDAIPLKHPDITWPQSVSRHPLYMRDLVRFNQIFGVSQSSRQDLMEYWNWLKVGNRPSVSHLVLGADFFDRSPQWIRKPSSIPLVLNVGIIEPRKNQAQLLDVAIQLWESGLMFDLVFAGRVNPHFGKPIEKKIKDARKAGYSVHLLPRQSDELLLELYSRAHFSVFNSIAEGFGLPVVESLWLGVPCICSQLPSLSELPLGAACKVVDSKSSLFSAVKHWLTDPTALRVSSSAAQKLTLPTWDDSANTLLDWAENSQTR